MSLNTYLTFDDNCREAFAFYRDAFGGDFSIFSTYADAPAELNVPEDEKDRVMHGSSVLMGSDSCSAFGPAPTVGDNFAISIVAESREHCDEMCAKLSEGGTIRMPLAETFWSAYFGMWTDRFGVNWMINYELPQS